MRGLSGALLIGIGLLHTLFGLVVGRHRVTAIARDGLWNAVGSDLGRNSIFWFLFTGFVLLILGHLCLWVERTSLRPVPALVGWELLALAALGIVLMPASSFWLVLSVAALIGFRAHRWKVLARAAPGR